MVAAETINEIPSNGVPLGYDNLSRIPKSFLAGKRYGPALGSREADQRLRQVKRLVAA